MGKGKSSKDEEIKNLKRSGKKMEESVQQCADKFSDLFNSREAGQDVQSYISKKVNGN